MGDYLEGAESLVKNGVLPGLDCTYPLLLSPAAKVVRVWLAGRLLSETFLLKCLYVGSRRTGCYLSAKAAR